MRMIRFMIIIPLVALAATTQAEDIYKNSNWPALASDRRAELIGDVLTILVFENSSATNAVGKKSKKRNAVDGQILAGSGFDKSGGVSFGGTYQGEGGNSRSDRIVAQLSATIQQVYPNGDLFVTGWQRLKINGELTNIKVSGRVRREDISGQNSVLSSRIADASIEYDGRGFASRSAKPGIVTKLFSWLGLM
jgi:flagellar L-ring protein FlgH